MNLSPRWVATLFNADFSYGKSRKCDEALAELAAIDA